MLAHPTATPAADAPSAKKLKSLATVEKQEFTQVFAQLKTDLESDLGLFKVPAQGKEWILKMLEHNALGGKMNRGMTVKSALQSILKRELTPQETLEAQILGWCVELLQAFFLVADDIMDASITRRGQPCWYRQEQVGMIAINDSFLLESFIYRLLKKYFKSTSYYTELLDLFHEVTYQTELGQLMDLITAPEENVDLNRFSIDK
jgi:farnesyl diphosphate synthase